MLRVRPQAVTLPWIPQLNEETSEQDGKNMTVDIGSPAIHGERSSSHHHTRTLITPSSSPVHIKPGMRHLTRLIGELKRNGPSPVRNIQPGQEFALFLYSLMSLCPSVYRLRISVNDAV